MEILKWRKSEAPWSGHSCPERPGSCRFTVRALFLFLWVAGAQMLWPQVQVAGEYEVKAALLYKFASFVEWPPETSGSELCIGVVGQDPFGVILDQVVKGKSINGRGFILKRLKFGEDPAGCHILFVSASERAKLRPILDRLEAAGVLTVSDIPGFCRAGGMIGLEMSDQRVRFEINPDAAERGRLKLSSKLLSLARIVREERVR